MKSFHKRENGRNLGIVATDGQTWTNQRRFSLKQLRDLGRPVFQLFLSKILQSNRLKTRFGSLIRNLFRRPIEAPFNSKFFKNYLICSYSKDFKDEKS